MVRAVPDLDHPPANRAGSPSPSGTDRTRGPVGRVGSSASILGVAAAAAIDATLVLLERGLRPLVVSVDPHGFLRSGVVIGGVALVAILRHVGAAPSPHPVPAPIADPQLAACLGALRPAMAG